jgi:hypothetical protein
MMPTDVTARQTHRARNGHFGVSGGSNGTRTRGLLRDYKAF